MKGGGLESVSPCIARCVLCDPGVLVEKQEQVELMGDIFNAVYNTDLDVSGALSCCCCHGPTALCVRRQCALQ